jgi:hypothetical protein
MLEALFADKAVEFFRGLELRSMQFRDRDVDDAAQAPNRRRFEERR